MLVTLHSRVAGSVSQESPGGLMFGELSHCVSALYPSGGPPQRGHLMSYTDCHPSPQGRTQGRREDPHGPMFYLPN